MTSNHKQKEFIEGTSLLRDEHKLGDISPESIALFKKYSTKWHYQKGQTIFESGDYIHNLMYIDKGSVVYELISTEGDKKIVSYVNCFLSAESYFNKQPILYFAKALEDTEIYALNNQYVNEILASPDIRNFLLTSLSTLCRILGWQVNDLAFCSTRVKVCRILCCYALAMPEGNQFKVTLTHQNLAFITGVHRVTITNILAQLRNEGLIEMKHSGHIVIRDWDQVMAIGFGDTLHLENNVL